MNEVWDIKVSGVTQDTLRHHSKQFYDLGAGVVRAGASLSASNTCSFGDPGLYFWRFLRRICSASMKLTVFAALKFSYADVCKMIRFFQSNLTSYFNYDFTKYRI